MKQNVRKKALFPAVAMALASVIALSGVTYAWFTTGNTAQVTGMDVNVQTANGIQISLDASSWKSSINSDDIKKEIAKGNASQYASATNQYPTGEILPVSSAGTVDANGKMEMYYGEIMDNGSLLSRKEEEKNRTSEGNFIAFDLFVKSGEQNLKLDLGDTLSYVKGTDKLGGNAEAGTERAVRVAFLNLGCGATPAAARALKGDGNVTPLIWEPNSETRASSVKESLEEEQQAGKLDYEGFNSASKEGGIDLKAVETFDASKELWTLKSGINKIRIYIWLEGQDVDCVNEISFGDFTTNLSFSVPEAEKE